MHAIRLQGRKTYLFAFIDDHSRAVMAARFGFAEDAIRLAAALRPALASRGIPAHAYVVVLDIPGSLAIRPAACGNDTPRRSLTFQALTESLGVTYQSKVMRRYAVAGGGLHVVASVGPSLPGAPPDPGAYQASCIEAYQASQTARGFSPVTIGNGTGDPGAVP